MQHDEIKDLLAAYALGSVGADEKREVDIHLMSCEACRDVLADYEAVSGSLAMAVEASELPAGFKERVIATAVGERGAEAQIRTRTWTRFGILAGAALLAAVIAVGGTIIESNSDAQRRQDVLALLSSNEGISLTGEGDVIGKVSGAKFAIAGVDEAPEGKTYQLWLMRGDDCPSEVPAECDLVSAGTFEVEGGVALVKLESSADHWEDAAVTIEDDEGAEFPTTDPLVHSL